MRIIDIVLRQSAFMHEEEQKPNAFLGWDLSVCVYNVNCLRHGVRKEQSNETRTPEVQKVTSVMESPRYAYTVYCM